MLYLFLVSLPLLFGSDSPTSSKLFSYDFTTIQTGLSYMGLSVGFVLGCVFQIYAQTFVYRMLSSRNGEGRPEYRLLPLSVGETFITTLYSRALMWDLV